MSKCLAPHGQVIAAIDDGRFTQIMEDKVESGKDEKELAMQY